MPNRLWLLWPSAVLGRLLPQPVSRPACASRYCTGMPTACATASACGRILSMNASTLAGNRLVDPDAFDCGPTGATFGVVLSIAGDAGFRPSEVAPPS